MKFPEEVPEPDSAEVAPLAGAWIEMNSGQETQRWRTSLPSRGVWIAINILMPNLFELEMKFYGTE